MRYAIISDVHSNLEALHAVFDDIDRRGIKDILFLGDAVGYGPNPNECISELQGRCKVLLAGNHDWAALGLTSVEGFNPFARAAVAWTAEVLSAENRKVLKRFPLVKSSGRPSLMLVHSSPFEPKEWHYLFSPFQAAGAFGYFSRRICLVGHSHVPFIVQRTPSGRIKPHDNEARFTRGSRYVINVGSVGQPRDGDPRACYALLEDGGVRFVRVEYPVQETQRKMVEADLPSPLIYRLSFGK